MWVTKGNKKVWVEDKEKFDELPNIDDEINIIPQGRPQPHEEIGVEKTMKVYIDGKETNLNALDYLKFALDVRKGKRKPLGNIE